MSFAQDDTTILVRQLCLGVLGVPFVIFTGIMIYLHREKHARFASTSSETQEEQNRPHIQAETCCICFTEMTKKVIATCGHSFCAKCFIEYWKFKLQSKLECPLCRKSINHITCQFITSDGFCPDGGELKKTISEVNRYNIYFSNQPKKWNEVLQDLPYFVKRMMSSLLENLHHYIINLIFCLVLLSMLGF